MAEPGELSEAPVLEMVDAAVASIHAPDATIIDHIQWSVRRNQYWIVGGVPGSGKSDLLVTAAGLMRPQAGVVRLLGQDIAHLPEEERMRTQLRVGIVFGDGGRLFSHLTVAENLALPLCYHHNCTPDASEQRVRRVLELMDLTEFASRPPALVNRNLRQRVALARALVLSPEVLFLDNPLIGLDPRESRWWLEFLNHLRQGHPLVDPARGLTLVAGTDDLGPWSEDGRQFALISNGRFLPVGDRTDLAKASIPALRELLPVDWLEE